MLLGTKRYLLWLGAVAVVAAAGWYFWDPGSVPLVSLTENDSHLFKQAFDGSANDARVVLLLSPT
ncbi:MAG: hypothetical protein WAM69_14935 [Candidatus Sulfotelmatobacter sp.]